MHTKADLDSNFSQHPLSLPGLPHPFPRGSRLDNPSIHPSGLFPHFLLSVHRLTLFPLPPLPLETSLASVLGASKLAREQFPNKPAFICISIWLEPPFTGGEITDQSCLYLFIYFFIHYIVRLCLRMGKVQTLDISRRSW